MKTLRFLRRELVQILLLALPFALAAACWNKMPHTVVTHWGIHGEPDGWTPRAPGVLGLPVLNVAVCLFIAAAPWIDPRQRRNPRAHTARQRHLRRIYRGIISGFVSVLASMIVAAAVGWRVDPTWLGYNGTLVLFAVIGNYIGSLEPGYLTGFRTPWTLADEATWRATHRLTGRWMVFGAVALLGMGIFLPAPAKFALVLVYVVGLGAWSVGYSAWFFHRRRTA